MRKGQHGIFWLAHADVQRPLSPEQEAYSIMVAHFIENSLYYGLFYHRWINPTVGLWLSAHSLMLYLCRFLMLPDLIPSVMPFSHRWTKLTASPCRSACTVMTLLCQPPLCCLVSFSANA